MRRRAKERRPRERETSPKRRNGKRPVTLAACYWLTGQQEAGGRPDLLLRIMLSSFSAFAIAAFAALAASASNAAPLH